MKKINKIAYGLAFVLSSSAFAGSSPEPIMNPEQSPAQQAKQNLDSAVQKMHDAQQSAAEQKDQTALEEINQAVQQVEEVQQTYPDQNLDQAQQTAQEAQQAIEEKPSNDSSIQQRQRRVEQSVAQFEQEVVLSDVYQKSSMQTVLLAETDSYKKWGKEEFTLVFGQSFGSYSSVMLRGMNGTLKVSDVYITLGNGTVVHVEKNFKLEAGETALIELPYANQTISEITVEASSLIFHKNKGSLLVYGIR